MPIPAEINFLVLSASTRSSRLNIRKYGKISKFINKYKQNTKPILSTYEIATKSKSKYQEIHKPTTPPQTISINAAGDFKFNTLNTPIPIKIETMPAIPQKDSTSLKKNTPKLDATKIPNPLEIG